MTGLWLGHDRSWHCSIRHTHPGRPLWVVAAGSRGVGPRRSEGCGQIGQPTTTIGDALGGSGVVEFGQLVENRSSILVGRPWRWRVRGDR